MLTGIVDHLVGVHDGSPVGQAMAHPNHDHAAFSRAVGKMHAVAASLMEPSSLPAIPNPYEMPTALFLRSEVYHTIANAELNARLVRGDDASPFRDEDFGLKKISLEWQKRLRDLPQQWANTQTALLSPTFDARRHPHLFNAERLCQFPNTLSLRQDAREMMAGSHPTTPSGGR
jgi:hypothetical protein